MFIPVNGSICLMMSHFLKRKNSLHRLLVKFSLKGVIAGFFSPGKLLQLHMISLGKTVVFPL